MTSPKLAFGVRGRGRHYPYPPVSPAAFPRNRWGSVDPESIPPHVAALPSVTNVLSVVDKPGLQTWSGEQAIRSLYSSGAIPLDVEAAVESHKNAHQTVARKAADQGTRAHTIADRLTQDLPLPSDLSDLDEAYADAYLGFWKDHNPTPLTVEGTVLDPDVGYGGTADLFAVIDGRTVVVDYKSKSVKPDAAKLRRYGVMYDEHRMQLAALAHAPFLAVEGDGWQTVPSHDVEGGLIVVLYPDGDYATGEMDLADLERWFGCFRGLLQAWRVLKGVEEVAA